MNKIDIQDYEDNQYQFIIDFYGEHLFWYQKLFLKMMLKKDSIVNRLKIWSIL